MFRYVPRCTLGGMRFPALPAYFCCSTTITCARRSSSSSSSSSPSLSPQHQLTEKLQQVRIVVDKLVAGRSPTNPLGEAEERVLAKIVQRLGSAYKAAGNAPSPPPNPDQLDSSGLGLPVEDANSVIHQALHQVTVLLKGQLIHKSNSGNAEGGMEEETAPALHLELVGFLKEAVKVLEDSPTLAGLPLAKADALGIAHKKRRQNKNAVADDSKASSLFASYQILLRHHVSALVLANEVSDLLLLVLAGAAEGSTGTSTDALKSEVVTLVQTANTLLRSTQRLVRGLVFQASNEQKQKGQEQGDEEKVALMALTLLHELRRSTQWLKHPECFLQSRDLCDLLCRTALAFMMRPSSDSKTKLTGTPMAAEGRVASFLGSHVASLAESMAYCRSTLDPLQAQHDAEVGGGNSAGMNSGGPTFTDVEMLECLQSLIQEPLPTASGLVLRGSHLNFVTATAAVPSLGGTSSGSATSNFQVTKVLNEEVREHYEVANYHGLPGRRERMEGGRNYAGEGSSPRSGAASTLRRIYGACSDGVDTTVSFYSLPELGQIASALAILQPHSGTAIWQQLTTQVILTLESRHLVNRSISSDDVFTAEERRAVGQVAFALQSMHTVAEGWAQSEVDPSLDQLNKAHPDDLTDSLTKSQTVSGSVGPAASASSEVGRRQSSQRTSTSTGRVFKECFNKLSQVAENVHLKKQPPKSGAALPARTGRRRPGRLGGLKK